MLTWLPYIHFASASRARPYHIGKAKSLGKNDRILLAKSGSERGEARGAGGGARDRPEPVAQAGEVDRGRGRDVLQVGPGQAAVAAAAQTERATPCERVPSIPA